MKGKMFKNLSNQEKRAKLLSTLVHKTEGTVSEDLLLNIVNNINIDLQYRITVVSDSKKFAEKATLKTDMNWYAGNENEGDVEWWINLFIGQNHIKSKNDIEDLQAFRFNTDTLDWRFDSVKFMFGVDYKSEKYEYNTHETDKNDFISQVDFDVTEPVAFVKVTGDWSDSLQIEYSNKYELIIYRPKNQSYKINKKVQYVLDNFSIKEE